MSHHMKNLTVGAWFDVSEGCPMRYTVGGSNLAHLMLGDTELELAFDAESLRAFAAMTAAAVAWMDTLFEQEEADREVREHRELVALGRERSA